MARALGLRFAARLQPKAASRHKRPGERRPSGLMRGAKTLSGLAVEVLVEEERVAPRRVILEAGVCAMGGSPAVRVEHKQTKQTAPEFICDLGEIGFPARSSRQLDRQVFAEAGVEVPQDSIARKFSGNQIGPRQLELPPKRPER
jgi:hypothetical protein